MIGVSDRYDTACCAKCDLGSLEIGNGRSGIHFLIYRDLKFCLIGLTLELLYEHFNSTCCSVLFMEDVDTLSLGIIVFLLGCSEFLSS